jgi:hypothetical protein
MLLSIVSYHPRLLPAGDVFSRSRLFVDCSDPYYPMPMEGPNLTWNRKEEMGIRPLRTVSSSGIYQFGQIGGHLGQAVRVESQISQLFLAMLTNGRNNSYYNQ